MTVSFISSLFPSWLVKFPRLSYGAGLVLLWCLHFCLCVIHKMYWTAVVWFKFRLFRVQGWSNRAGRGLLTCLGVMQLDELRCVRETLGPAGGSGRKGLGVATYQEVEGGCISFLRSVWYPTGPLDGQLGSSDQQRRLVLDLRVVKCSPKPKYTSYRPLTVKQTSRVESWLDWQKPSKFQWGWDFVPETLSKVAMKIAWSCLPLD